jgi:hypothetical protein
MTDKMITTIEWLVETLNDDGTDITEVCHFATYAEAVDWAKDHEPCSIGLVRDVGNDLEGIVDRQWVYLDIDGTLPSHFEDGAKVPARYHNELRRQA